MKNLEDKYWQKAENMKGTGYAGLNRDRVRIGVAVTDEMLDALKSRAIKERRSVAGMVRHLVIQGLSE